MTSIPSRSSPSDTDLGVLKQAVIEYLKEDGDFPMPGGVREEVLERFPAMVDEIVALRCMEAILLDENKELRKALEKLGEAIGRLEKNAGNLKLALGRR